MVVQGISERETGMLSEEEIDTLRNKSIESLSMSYSPYSKFRVGCAILTESGAIVQGANVENASYGAGVCAERATICTAVNQGHTRFKAIAIASDLKDEFITPCGICRQFIREFGKDTPIYMFKNGVEGTFHMTLSQLLPHSFGPEQLN